MGWESLAQGRVAEVSYGYKSTGAADCVFQVFNALGQISFVLAGHTVVLEIQATIQSTPDLEGAQGAYFINAICYSPGAMIGYWAFGQEARLAHRLCQSDSGRPCRRE